MPRRSPADRLDDAAARDWIAATFGAKAAPGAGISVPAAFHDGSGSYGLGDARAMLSDILGLSPGADFNYEAEAGDPWRNTATAAVLRVIEANFPEPDLQVVGPARSESEEVPIEGDPGAMLFKAGPNPGYDYYTWSAAMATFAVLDGNAYSLLITSEAGVPVEHWWCPNWMIEPVWDRSGTQFVGGYLYRVNGREYVLPPESVLHWRWGKLDPRNPRKGLSAYKAAAARVLCGLNEADGFVAQILRNAGVPSVIIAPAGSAQSLGIAGDQARSLKATWIEQLGGENRGKPFVPTYPVSVTPVGFSPEQLALDRIPARLEDQVCALTGVNPMIAGLSSGADHKTYANMEAARRGLYDELLIPLQKSLAAALTRHLTGRPGMPPKGHRFRFCYDGVACLADAQDAVWDRAGKAYAVYKGIKRAEYRRLIGQEAGPEDEIYYDQASAAAHQASTAASDPVSVASAGDGLRAAIVVTYPGGREAARDPFDLTSTRLTSGQQIGPLAARIRRQIPTGCPAALPSTGSSGS